MKYVSTSEYCVRRVDRFNLIFCSGFASNQGLKPCTASLCVSKVASVTTNQKTAGKVILADRTVDEPCT